MSHVQSFQPGPRLAPYIEEYYIIQSGGESEIVLDRVFPDGGIYLTFSLDGEVYDHSRSVSVKPKTLYLAGTMTRFHNEKVSTNTNLFGIHFKPACFSSFFDYPLHEIADEMIEFQQIVLSETVSSEYHLITLVERFLLSRLSVSITGTGFILQPVLEDIYRTHGNIEIGKLTSKYFLTERKLERLFKRYTGIAPLAFSKIVRFDYTLNKIIHRDPQKSLLNIAHDCGYYDHAHLARDVKKYTGLTPSQL